MPCMPPTHPGSIVGTSYLRYEIIKWSSAETFLCFYFDYLLFEGDI